MRWLALLALPLLAACVSPVTTPTAPVPAPQPPAAVAPQPVERLSARQAARQFVDVVTRMEPVAEQVCREVIPQENCDFAIVVDDTPGAPPNAFQTRDATGRPILAFTIPLIAEMQNPDELAFVMGHEAAHHIAGHLDRQQRNMISGAVLLGSIAAITGASAEAVQSAQELGAQVGARSYSKEFELEADRLGTLITKRAGYDPVRGAAYFARIPDPGNRFLGTHPPNASRIEAVRQTAAGL